MKSTLVQRGLVCFIALFLLGFAASAQTTVSTGSIQGTLTDPSGAAIGGATVKITNKGTGQTLSINSNSDGIYNSGGLLPGDYEVRVEAQGFSAAVLNLAVEVGRTGNGNIRLTIGQASQTVEVTGSATGVNPDQATVQGVLTAQQIDTLPINGRNFLDLAQLEPGVQIQDGTNFDPTKVGYSSISFGGRFGRTARISVDGVDISDETVGTTTEDIPSSGIQEFGLSQSNLDLSNDLTSSGAVNVITRSGTNEFHGELFYLIRDSRWSAQLPHPVGIPAPYQRNQFGGRFGGPIIRDKLFFFMDYERTKQDESVPVLYASPFQGFSGSWQSPFRENEPMARVDWQISNNFRAFYRFNYFSNDEAATYFSSSFQVYRNKDYTRNHVAGLDFNTGQFTHTIRFSVMHFINNITDGTAGSSLPLANLGVNLNINNGPQTGPNWLAPQATPQHDTQIKYDGGKPLGTHFVRYGVNYNRIESGGFAGFYSIAPQVQSNFIAGDDVLAAAGPYPGGASNPLNYPVETVILSNGQGFSTEHAGLGYPAGLLGPDNRFGAYIGDTWKIKPNLTMIYGLRWVRDTGRTDSDLPAISELDAAIPGDGGRVHQPNFNFAPQIGFAWDPASNGKTVFRIGSGLFYENVIFNNILFDRPLRLQNGAFLQNPYGCNSSRQAQLIPIPGGTTMFPQSLCDETVGQAASSIAGFQQYYAGLQKFDLAAANPNYVGTDLASGVNIPVGLFYPGYKSPRSLQMNAGFQHEFKPGVVLTMDYLRNITTHTLLGIDTNHVGDVNHFNKAAAQTAVATTLAQCGVSTIVQGLAGCPNPTAYATANGLPAGPLSMSDFAYNGLTSPGLDFGGTCPYSYGCAFSGINPNAPQIPMLKPIGRSVYNGLDVKLTARVERHFLGFHDTNLQIAYSLSRFVNPGGMNPSIPGNNDQDFVISAVDNNNPLRYMGPSLLDRTHQLSFGIVSSLPFSFQTSVIGHFYSGLPLTLQVPTTGLGPGEIFRTDFTGDGTVSDVLPGTLMGSFGRGISASQLGNVIQNYNNTVANQATPAGQVVIANGIMTLAQLQALGGVAPTVSMPPGNEVGTGPMRAFDLKFSWDHKFGERFEIEPSAGIYNLFNFTNYDLPPNILTGLLTGSAGSVNGTSPSDRITNRVGLGTGVFALGAPRAIEFGIRISF